MRFQLETRSLLCVPAVSKLPLCAFCFATAFVLNACGGGGTSIGAPTALPSATPASGSTAPGHTETASPSPAPASRPTATATPATTSAPGASSTPASSLPDPSTPPYSANYTTVLPAQPAVGQSRTGAVYNVYITAPTGDTVAFTVFEPATLTGGQTYPLILHGPGYSATRETALTSPLPSSTAGANTGDNLSEMVQAGYGAISFDDRGFGQTTGKDRTMDPDFEGKDVLAVLDWAQNKLPWIAFAPTLEGDDPREPVVGTIGGSYGGMYQYMLLNIDKRHRVRAITPNIAPSNLNYALFPNTVPKTTFDLLLFVAGNDSTGPQYATEDPFVQQTFVTDLAADQEDSLAADFFGYHSADYWYNGVTIATNGGTGTMPLLAPTKVVPKVNALIYIGVRDGLFNFNNGYHNYVGLKSGGGDVRLLSYQAGHNALSEAPPDPGAALYFPANDDLDSRCGATLNQDQAQLAWMNEYLKGMSGAASIIPVQPCISLAKGDAVTLPAVSTNTSGPLQTSYDIGSQTIVSGSNIDVPTAVSLYTAGPSGDVEAGIPHIHFTVEPIAGVNLGTPIIFVGIGQTHASSSTPTNWDLIDNQILPLRGTGVFDLDLIGGGARLQPGDKLGVLIYGLHDQFAATGSVNIKQPTVEPLTVTGTISLPLVGSVSTTI